MKILIADDDEIILDLLELTLASEGYDTVRAANGKEAIAKIHEEKIHMVISDWNMPGISGLDLVKYLRDEMVDRYIYTILLTCRNSSEDIVLGMASGADDFIIKPFDPSELIVRVKAGIRILSLETCHVTIFALAKLAESRDPETGLHLERMREYSKVLSSHLIQHTHYGKILPSDFTEMIYLTSPLHDVGKVGIPDSILLKQGRLSADEFEIMKKHTTIGAETLNAAVEQFPHIQYLSMARDIALYHHESFDGNGYPEKLVGEEIPLCARIVSLADVYDALTSKRIYKEAYTHDEAKDMIINRNQAKFDPLVIKAFLENEDVFIQLKSEIFNDKILQTA